MYYLKRKRGNRIRDDCVWSSAETFLPLGYRSVQCALIINSLVRHGKIAHSLPKPQKTPCALLKGTFSLLKNQKCLSEDFYLLTVQGGLLKCREVTCDHLQKGLPVCWSSPPPQILLSLEFSVTGGPGTDPPPPQILRVHCISVKACLKQYTTQKIIA